MHPIRFRVREQSSLGFPTSLSNDENIVCTLYKEQFGFSMFPIVSRLIKQLLILFISLYAHQKGDQHQEIYT